MEMLELATELKGARAEITRLRAELAECKRDAERYRWLRLHSWVEEDATPAILFSRGCDQQNPEFLDEAIDEAREGEGEA